SATSPCTDGPPSCSCQPTNGVPSYSMTSLKRGIPLSPELRARTEFGAAQEFLRGHRLPACALQLDDPHGAVRAGHVEMRAQQDPGRALAFAAPRAQHLDAQRRAGLRELEPGARNGREAAALIVHGFPRTLPFDPGLAVLDLRRERHAGCGLRSELQGAALEASE